MSKFFTDAEVDELLQEVEQAVNTSARLAKNAGAPQEDTEDAPAFGGGDPAAQGAADPAAGDPAAAPAGGDPAAQGAADPAAGGADPMAGDPAAAGGDPAAAGGDPMGGQDGDPAADDGQGGDPAAQGGDDQLQDDAQGGEELSDQELHQIYTGMEPADLERHYMVIRSVLRQAYQKFEKTESQTNGEEPMSQAEKKKFQDQIDALQKSNKEMEDSLAGAIKAVEIMAKPTRKAVVGTVEVVQKSEGQGQGQGADFSGLSKAEITAKINDKVKDHTLSKDDRYAMNRYVLSKTEEGREKVLAILGGKK